MLWKWFEDESRIGSEGMRPEQSTGLTAYDFKQMLDEHEASLLADIALKQPSPPAQPSWQSAVNFCQWLKGYFSTFTGRDELTAFEANTIRAELYEKVFPSTPITSTQREPAPVNLGGDLTYEV